MSSGCYSDKAANLYSSVTGSNLSQVTEVSDGVSGRVSGIHVLEETAAALAGTAVMCLEMKTLEIVEECLRRRNVRAIC